MSAPREQTEDARPYTPAQEQWLLKIARHAVHQALEGHPPQPPTLSADLAWMNEPRACFVTLHHRHGHLRGCIGTFETGRPLLNNLVDMAAAATRDPRFVNQPVTLGELTDLVIEVSVLTPLEPMDDPLAMRIGTDGIVIEHRGRPRAIRGCFLPQVAVDQGWDAAQTLSACCSHKMGLEPDAWRTSESLAFYRFQAIVMSEHPPQTMRM